MDTLISESRKPSGANMQGNLVGMTIKTNMMGGRPSRVKSSGDYIGLPITPCGDYSTKESKVPRPPWLPAIVRDESMS